MKLILQSLLLILSFILVYLWQTSSLTAYTIPILGLLLFLFLITFFRKRKSQTETQKQPKIFSGDGLWTIFFLNTIIFLFIFSTGGINSPLFFLLYFLSFSIGFVLNPLTVFVFMAGSILVFLPEILQNNLFENSIKVGSLVLISPLSYFFGLQNQFQEETASTASKIASTTKKVLEKEADKLTTDDQARLKEVIAESEKLKKNI